MSGYDTSHSETALTINDTHQLLKYFEEGSRFDHLAAFAPTQNWEKISGYDVEVPFLKTSVYQYKRPKIAGETSWTVADRQFELDMEQWLTLVLLFDPGEAFFALPVCWTDEEMTEAADRTVFVDAHGILPNTSRTYIPHDSVTNGEIETWIKAKINGGERYLIHPKYLYGWHRHREQIDSCELGLRVWNLDIESLPQYRNVPDEEHETHFSPPKTTEFEAFQERIDTVGGEGDDSGEKRRDWARRRLWRVLKRLQYDYEVFYTYLAFVEHWMGRDSIEGNLWEFAYMWQRGGDLVDDGMDGAWWILSEFSEYDSPMTAMPENSSSVDSARDYIRACIDREAAFETLESVLTTFEEEDVDPSRFRVGNSRHLMFGGDNPP